MQAEIDNDNAPECLGLVVSNIYIIIGLLEKERDTKNDGNTGFCGNDRDLEPIDAMLVR